MTPVNDEQVAHVGRDFDTNNVMREVTNKLLGAARKRSTSIECFDDINAYLVANPDDDEFFAKLYEESGYLTAWEVEFRKNRWQYDFPLLVSMPGSQADKRAYCVGVIRDHSELLVRHEENRAGYTILHAQHGLRTFANLKSLYKKLVDLQLGRRAVALRWLQQFAPDALPEPAKTGSLTPHTEEWLAALTWQNPRQAGMTRMLTALGGSSEVCSFCGDSPARDHRYIGNTGQPTTVGTCKLCDDCRRIRKMLFDEDYSPL